MLLEAENIHDEWKEKMGGTTRKIAELEVSLRKKELKDLLYDLALSRIEAKMIERRIINDMPASEVTNKDYASLITYSLVGNLTDLQASRFGFTKATGTSFAADNMDDEAQNNQSGPLLFSIDLIMTKKIKLDKLVTKFKNEESAIVNVVKEEIEPLFLGTTFLLWGAISKEDGTGTVDAQICRYSQTQNPGRIIRVQ